MYLLSTFLNGQKMDFLTKINYKGCFLAALIFAQKSIFILSYLLKKIKEGQYYDILFN